MYLSQFEVNEKLLIFSQVLMKTCQKITFKSNPEQILHLTSILMKEDNKNLYFMDTRHGKTTLEEYECMVLRDGGLQEGPKTTCQSLIFRTDFGSFA